MITSAQNFLELFHTFSTCKLLGIQKILDAHIAVQLLARAVNFLFMFWPLNYKTEPLAQVKQ